MKLVLTKREENPSLCMFWQTTLSVTIQNWLEFTFSRHIMIILLLHNINNRDKYCKTNFPQETTSWPTFVCPNFACANSLEFQVQVSTPSIYTHAQKKKVLFLKERSVRKLRKKANKLNIFQTTARSCLQRTTGKEEKDNIHVGAPSLTIKMTYQQDLKTQRSKCLEKG